MAEEVLTAVLRADLSAFRTEIQRGMAEFRQQSQLAQQSTQQLQNSLNALTATTQKNATATIASQKEMRAGFTSLAATTRQSANQMQQTLGGVSTSIARGGEATKKLASDVRQGFTQAASATTHATQVMSSAFTSLNATTRAGFAGTTASVKSLQGELQRMGTTLQSVTAIERTSTAQLVEMQRQTALLTRSTDQAQQSTRGFGAAWAQVRTILAGVSISLIGRESIQASNQLIAMQNAFKVITGSAQGSAEALQFVRGEANRLGLDFATSAQSFQGLAAAARGTSLEGRGAQEVFTAVAEAGRVLGLSNDQMGGTFIALQQIMSKGTVQSEELRGQLGERLPGAFQVAARAMGVTTAQLSKMLEQGQVLSDQFLPRFAAQLRKELGSGATEAAQTFAAGTNRMFNALNELLVSLGDLVTRNTAASTALDGLSRSILTVRDAVVQLRDPLQTVIGLLGAGFSTIIASLSDRIKQLGTTYEDFRKKIDTLRETKAPSSDWVATYAEAIAKGTASLTPFIGALTRAGVGLTSLATAGAGFLQDILFPDMLNRATEEMDRLTGGAFSVRQEIIQLEREGRSLQQQIEANRQEFAALNEIYLKAPTKEHGQRLAELNRQYAGFQTTLHGTEARVNSLYDTLAQRQAQAAAAPPILVPEFTGLTPGPVTPSGLGAKEGEVVRQTYDQLKNRIAEINRQRALGLPITTALKAEEQAIQKALEDSLEVLGKNPNIQEQIRTGTRAQVQEMSGWLSSTQEQQKALQATGRTAVDGLERTSQKIRELQAYLANPPKDATAGEIDQAHNRLNDLLNRQLPEVLQGFAKARQEAEGLQRVLASGLATPIQRLALQDQLDQLNREQLPQALQATQALKDEIASMQRQLTVAIEANLPDEQVDELRIKLAGLRQEWEQTRLSLESRLDPQALAELRQKAEATEESYEKLTERIREQIQFEYQLAQASATSAAQRQEAQANLAESLRKSLNDERGARQVEQQAQLDRIQTDKQLLQTRIEQEYQLKLVSTGSLRDQGAAFGLFAAQRKKQQDEVFTDYITQLQEAGVDESRIQDLIFTRQRTQLEAQTEAWRRFSEDVQGFLADNIFDFLTGRSKDMEDVFSGLRDSILRSFSELTAKTVTDSLTGLLKPDGAIGTALQGIFQAVGFVPTTGPLQGPTPSGATLDTQGNAVGSIAGAGAVSSIVSGVAAGVTAGIGVQQLSANLFESSGLRGKAGSALSGALGGAVGGAVIGSVVPVIGTLIGAIAGAVIGGAAGGILGKDVEMPHVGFSQVNAPSFRSFGGRIGLQQPGVAALEPVWSQISNIGDDELENIRQGIQQAGDKLYLPLIADINQLPKRLHDNILSPLNRLNETFRSKLGGQDFEKHLAENIEDFLNNDLPRDFQAIFGPFQKALNKIAPIAQSFDQIIDAIQQQQRQVLGRINQAQQNIREALFSPAQLFETRQAELQTLLTRFETGGAATQVRLAPEIAQLTEEIFGLARNEEVLGQDQTALRALQSELQTILTDVEAATKERFGEQKDVALRQLDLLQQQLVSLNNVDTAVNKSLIALENLDAFFRRAFSGSFQAGGEVPKTGLALIHRGEVVIPQPIVQREKVLRESVSTLREQTHTLTQQAYPFVGAFQAGGRVPETGMGLLHRGEWVLPISQPIVSMMHQYSGPTHTEVHYETNYGDTHVTVHVPASTGGDPRSIAEYVGAEIERRQRLQQRPSSARRG